MPQDANQPKGWRGDGSQPKRTAKYGWKPKSAGIEKSVLMRRITQVSLALSVFMCIAVIVYIIYLLRAPEKTSIIIVAAKPSADAVNLQAPLDFHGWEGSRKLMRYVGTDVATAEILPKNNPPFALSDETLPNLGALVQDTPSKNVIIYFGLLGFAGADGPCLYGSNGRIVKVKDLVRKVGEIAESHGKDVVLLFDAVRLPVAPELGVLRNDFVAALEETLGKDIRNMKHLAVICSSSPGERAWNSDEWGCTVFLQQVIEALRGAAKAKRKSNDIELKEFFDTVQEQTSRWTSLRYVSQQTPLCIVGEKVNPLIVVQRNDEYVNLVDTDKANAPGYDWVVSENAATPNRLKLLKTHGDQVAALAQSRPHPAVYTPISWRRYRELLVRLEQALRMNDDDANETVAALDQELNQLNKSMKEAQTLTFKGVSDTNTIWPVVLANTPSNVMAAARQAKNALGRVPVLTEPAPVDAENHLAFKLAQFWDKRSNPPSAETVKLALQTRQLAERAALGCPVDSPEYFYTERLWEWIHPELKELDAKRRIAEDYLFSDNHSEAVKILNEVNQKYTGLIARYQPLQSAWGTYHYAVSEAAILTKWHVFCADNLQDKDRAESMQQLWRTIHQLEKKLRTINLTTSPTEMETVAKSCSEIDRLLRNEMKRFTDSVRENIEKAAESNKNRHLFEMLLTFPWPIPTDRSLADDRLNLIVKARLGGRALHKTEVRTEKVDKPKELDKVVQYRCDLLHAMLISMLGKENQIFDGSAPSATRLGTELAALYRTMSDEASGKGKRILEADEAEEASRYALSFTGLPKEKDKEIAMSRRHERYQRLLREHARRICLDHWYNGKEQTPYFKKTARLYLDNEGFIVEPDQELKDLLEPKPLTWKPARPESVWTSELKRDWEIEVDHPQKKVEGRMALWAEPKISTGAIKPDQTPAIELNADDLKRESKPLNEPKRRLTMLARNVTGAESKKTELMFVPKAYFRGQELDGELVITLSRQPGLIVTEEEPKEGGTFTLTKEKKLRVGLGHLAIVLDFSGSMSKSPDGKDDWTHHDSRIKQAIRGLETMLINLSEKVDDIDLSIRIFSQETNANTELHKKLVRKGDSYTDESIKEVTNLIDSEKLFSGKLRKQGGNKRILIPHNDKLSSQSLDDFVKRLNTLRPYSYTPLLKSMEAARNDDTRDAVEQGESVTLLVLTDGADTSQGEVDEPKKDPDYQRKIETIARDFERKFIDSGLSIKMILFQVSPDEWTAANQQFVLKENDKSKISIRKAGNYDDLVNELLESFRVKMQVTRNNQIVRSREKNDPLYFVAREEGTPLSGLMFSDFLSGECFSSVWLNDRQRLSFGRGDHLFIKLKDARNQVKYSRELFKDVLKISQPEPAERYIQGQVDGRKTPWHMTVAENRDAGHLRLTLEHESNLVESSEGTPPLLSMYRPNFVWWDVKAEGEGNKDQNPQGTVHITHLPYYLAPGWDIDQGPTQDKLLKIQAWVSETTPQKENLEPFTRGDLKNDNVLKLNRLASVSCEKHYLTDGFQRTPEPVPCLVVRYRLAENAHQRVWFEKPAGVKRSDHCYFPEAQTMTVYFSPFNPEVDPEEKITLKMINLEELTRQLKRPVVNARIPMNQNWQGPSIDIK